MTLRGSILAGVTAAALLASGGVLASAINDLPQDAVPIQDPTASLNRQTPAQTPPIEPAPEAAPAPAAPIAVTPVTPPIVVAEAEEKEDEPEKAEAAPAKRVETPAAPARRQRRRVAIVEAIDKITAESMRFEVEVGGRPVRFQRTLIFTARACEVSAPDEQVSDAVAYLEVSLQPRGVIQVSEPRQIFRGWMFASSPAISGLQHPIYDAWIVGCRA
ncbi:hypothetical protein GCM10007859_16400 [Brevundimonas denitrificans]|uniref:DUF2155 domain-containing protein n=1 Tax=Brevundimonas denitrificans TaxID=1443434 RepID=A0ABQ6BKL4_9CAUL|nr:DUF2155 domain-containing protein [Brevundimonas denitrificans]GLS01625.1 hypothetical protein GCM10007859_16400 [Brevundimonas denitrificans]